METLLKNVKITFFVSPKSLSVVDLNLQPRVCGS